MLALRTPVAFFKTQVYLAILAMLSLYVKGVVQLLQESIAALIILLQESLLVFNKQALQRVNLLEVLDVGLERDQGLIYDL